MAQKMLLPDDVKRAIWLRMLLMFLFVIAFALASSYWQNLQTAGLRRAQRAAYGNCLAVQSVVQQGVNNVHASNALNPEQKAQALATYQTLLKNLDCEDLRP